jgi:hypothetical protein
MKEKYSMLSSTLHKSKHKIRYKSQKSITAGNLHSYLRRSANLCLDNLTLSTVWENLNYLNSRFQNHTPAKLKQKWKKLGVRTSFNILQSDI